MWDHLLTSTYLSDFISDPSPVAPPGQFATLVGTVLGWLKWTVFVGGLAGLLVCAIMITIGRRNRNAMATEGVAGGVWVLGGLSLAACAYPLVNAFMITKS